MEKMKRIFDRIEGLRNAMIEMQIRLSSVPAISPESGGKGEAEKADILLDFIHENGFEDVDILKAPDLDAETGYRPNIIARMPGQDTARTTWIMTHMDVVPPGEPALWDGNPFKPWVEQGKIFGRGVEDNQQDMVASLFALKTIRDEKVKPRTNAGIALVADEETGSGKGIEYVLKHGNPFKPEDLILVPDAGNSSGTMIEVAEKSILWLTFRTIGRQAHGSTPEKGINSLRAASYLIVELNRLYELFPEKNDLFDPPISTFEPTKKEVNVLNINTIPGEDVFSMDMRILPIYSVDDVVSSIREMTRKIESLFGVMIDIQTVQNAPAAPPTPAEAPIVRALQKAVKAVYGVDARPMGSGGGTVAAVFRRAGYPAACWSRSDETAHQPNEYCIIDNMVGSAKVFAHLFLQEE